MNSGLFIQSFFARCYKRLHVGLSFVRITSEMRSVNHKVYVSVALLHNVSDVYFVFYVIN